jgi:hypothetical protein
MRWALIGAAVAMTLVVAVGGWALLRRTGCHPGRPGCATGAAATASGQVGIAADGGAAVGSAGAAPSPSDSVSASPGLSSSSKPATGKPSPNGPAGPGTTGGGGAGCVGPSCAFPNAATTGPPAGALARHDGDISIKDNGAVLDRWDLHGSLDIYANNVTVSNCRVTSSNWWAINLRPGFTGLKVLHCTLLGLVGKGMDNGGENYAVSNMGNGTVEVGWCDVAEFGNALSMGHGNIHDNYVHDLSAFITQSGSWQHTDAVISDGGDSAGLIIRHNTLLNQTRVDQGASAAIGLYADNGAVQNTTVDRNWLAGGAYALYGGGKGATNIKVTDNVFSTQFWPNGGYYGMVTAWNAAGAGNLWSGNVTSAGAVVQP